MKTFVAAALMLLFGVGLVSASAIPFADNYQDALKEAAQKSQPVLITFYADW